MLDLMSEAVLIQAVGLIGSAVVITAFAQKSDAHFKMVMTLGAFVFAAHFALLGAYAGAAVSIINGLRSGLSIKFHKSNGLLAVFLILYVLAGIYVYETPIDLFPLFSSVLVTIGFFKLSGIKLRILCLITESSWLVYSVIMKSLGGFITNVFVLSANAITIYRLFKDKKVIGV